jgi:hypothetical protein
MKKIIVVQQNLNSKIRNLKDFQTHPKANVPIY